MRLIISCYPDVTLLDLLSVSFPVSLPFSSLQPGAEKLLRICSDRTKLDNP